MPNCASAEGWAKCSVSRMDDPMMQGNCSSDCVECEKLTDECAGYSGAGYGNCVPKSCVSLCCENSIPKIPDEVKKLLNSLSIVLFNKLNLSKEDSCAFQNFGSKSEVMQIILSVLFDLYQKGKLNLDNDNPPPELMEALKKQFLLNARQGKPCYNFENNQCRQGNFTNVQSKNIDDIECNTGSKQSMASGEKPFYETPIGITGIVVGVLVLVFLLFLVLRKK